MPAPSSMPQRRRAGHPSGSRGLTGLVERGDPINAIVERLAGMRRDGGHAARDAVRRPKRVSGVACSVVLDTTFSPMNLPDRRIASTIPDGTVPSAHRIGQRSGNGGVRDSLPRARAVPDRADRARRGCRTSSARCAGSRNVPPP
ncbi:hypothetical protein Maq22A_1p38400 (plasmid) [Methylobacterium aquaticum]|uniref:Uncharacterized protein n=1 Tax=Methylobacterium aquaticum TaxID=270351 RepID=A0A1Y0Z920_9HYPH|nr:hypothetical protein Maq22A_1p38400 [Methylobacterium aquaticum]